MVRALKRWADIDGRRTFSTSWAVIRAGIVNTAFFKLCGTKSWALESRASQRQSPTFQSRCLIGMIVGSS
jgi:hypothetical protein